MERLGCSSWDVMEVATLGAGICSTECKFGRWRLHAEIPPQDGSQTLIAWKYHYKAPTIMYTTSAIDTLESHIDELPASAVAPLAPGTV